MKKYLLLFILLTCFSLVQARDCRPVFKQSERTERSMFAHDQAPPMGKFLDLEISKGTSWQRTAKKLTEGSDRPVVRISGPYFIDKNVLGAAGNPYADNYLFHNFPSHHFW